MHATKPNAVGNGTAPAFRTKFLLFFGTLLIAFAGVELVLRMLWTNPYREEGPDRVVTLRLQHPHTHHLFNRAAVHPEAPEGRLRTDERSYILPSFQYPDPELTIAFLGGSTTECCAVAEELRFPALVSTQLAEHGYRVNTLNAGVSGNTLHDSINNLLNHVILDRPDVVVLMHACNDIGVLRGRGSYAPRSGQLAGWSDIARMTLMEASSYSSLLGLVRNVSRERLSVDAPPPATSDGPSVARVSEELDGAFESRLRSFVRVCHAFDVKPVLVTQPLANYRTELTPEWVEPQVQARFNDLIRGVAEEEDALVIDLVKHLEECVPKWDEHMHLFYDGMHVNDRGSKIYGSFMTSKLLPLAQLLTHRS